MPDFLAALRDAEVPVIMEVKRRDAHGRDLLGARSVQQIVAAYGDAGAPCLSVVTGRWFGGSLDLLREVARSSAVPVLQKDFITTDAQLDRARQLGASAVLLTAQLLPSGLLGKLIGWALRHGLTPFVEVTSEAELRAVTHGPQCVVAVNNRNIRERERDAGGVERSLSMLPAVLATGTTCPVSASGIDRPEVAARLIAAGFRGVLVGSGLLRATHPGDWLAEFRKVVRT